MRDEGEIDAATSRPAPVGATFGRPPSCGDASSAPVGEGLVPSRRFAPTHRPAQ